MRKEFSRRVQEILASTKLDREEKAKKIRYEATHLIERTIDRTPEMRDLRKRWAAAEKKLAGRNGYSYCPESGEWYPSLPPAIKSLDREYVGLMQEKVFETCRKPMREIYAVGAAQEV